MTENEVSSLGGKVGPRIGRIVADAVADTAGKLTEHKSSLAQKVLADFTNHVSDEVKEVMNPIFERLANDENVAPELRHVFNQLATVRGQALGWIGGSIAGTTMSAGLFDLINNWLAPGIHGIISDTPNSVLSPETVAQAIVRGIRTIVPGDNIEGDALSNGVNLDRLAILTQLAFERPSVNQTQDLVNRGIWGPGRAIDNLQRLGISLDDVHDLLAARIAVLSPAELATMFNRDVVTMAEGKHEAAKSGMPPEDFEKLAEIYGQPLSAQELAEAFRRGFIDRGRFERGIIQGPLRKEWFDVLEQLSYSRMSTIDAADAVNQGHMSRDEAESVAKANGLDPQDFQTLIDIAGAPPGVDFITEALNRGFIDEETFNQAFLESRIKNRYVHLFLEMRTRLIPQETVRLLYRNGVYSREATLDTLLKHGFTPDDANALISLEETRQDDTTKELTRAQIVNLYEVRGIDLETALTMLFGLGYSENNARAMIELADLQRLQKFINAAVTRVKAAYLAGRMDDNEASAQLDALGVPPEQRDDFLIIWDIDRSTVSKALTPSQIRQALKKELIDQGGAVSRLTAQGYAEDDALIFLQLTA